MKHTLRPRTGIPALLLMMSGALLLSEPAAADRGRDAGHFGSAPSQRSAPRAPSRSHSASPRSSGGIIRSRPEGRAAPRPRPEAYRGIGDRSFDRDRRPSGDRTYDRDRRPSGDRRVTGDRRPTYDRRPDRDHRHPDYRRPYDYRPPHYRPPTVYHPPHTTVILGNRPYRRYGNVIYVRPFRGSYPRYRRIYHSHDLFGWIAFTAITLALIDSLNDAQEREHELAVLRATRVPIGETVVWEEDDAYGSVTPVWEGRSDTGQYCREFQQEVTIGGKTEQAWGTACLRPDGSWEIVQ